MSISAGHRKQKINAMKAHRKQRQYIIHHPCHHCQLCHVTPSYVLIVGVCLLMLPTLELATEHAQLKTTYYINRINPRHMSFSHTPLALPSLCDVLPAIVLQNGVALSNSSTSYHSGHVSLSPTVPSGLGRRVVVRAVVLLLLLMSGDIETNPGPLGKWMTVGGVFHWKLN